MFKKILVPNLPVILMIVLLFSANSALAVERLEKPDRPERPERDAREETRVISRNKIEIQKAISLGCVALKEVKTLNVLKCPKGVSDDLSLEEDIQVFAADSGANTQIGASTVSTSGNTGAGRKIVVLDTGYNYNHPELSSSYLGGKDFVNNDSDPFDDNGHGSHVAGIITADGIDPKAKGVAPDAGILAGKVLDTNGSGYFSDIVSAIYWAVDGPDGVYDSADDFKAEAISLSLGTSYPYTYKRSYCNNVLPELTTAIKYAYDKGVVVVVAAGNEGTRGVSIPGCISYSTTVGAVDKSDRVASFSGRGSAVDISAPGVNIFSSLLNSSYASWNGTSMATPMVSGVVALIKSAHSTFTSSQIETALFNTTKDLGRRGKDTDFGFGRVNAVGAVK